MNNIVRRLVRLASVLAAAVFSSSSFAVYVVNQIDYIDPVTHNVANYTQLWGNTNNGRVIGVASFDGGVTTFSFVYDPATGNFSHLPQPPGFDGITSIASAISINDAGVITGSTFEPAGNRGFILNSGAFSFFSNPTWPNTWGRTMGMPTAAHLQGLVVGYSENGTSAINSHAGFVYDPVTSAFAALNTPNSYFTIAQGLNIGGQIVGHVRYQAGSGFPLADGLWGFLFTPTTGADPMLGGGVSYFRIGGMPTRARGINDNGVLAAAVSDASGATQTYVGTSSGFQQIIVPGSTGPACLGPDGGHPGTFPEGLNNAGQVTGIFWDSACNSHGFIATPAFMPTGTTSGGAYTFSVDVVPNVPIFIDPAIAVGYDYEIGKRDPRFASVRLPLGIGNNKFVLVVGHKAFDLNAGQLFDFRARGFKKGVKAFRVACIDPAAALDPANPMAFPTELTFTAAGRFTGTQTPLTSASGEEDDDDDHRHGSRRHHDDEPMSQAECRRRLLSAHDAGGRDD